MSTKGLMKNCLIVDDSALSRTVARKILEDLDFRVCEASNFGQGLKLCEITVPDVVMVEWEARGTSVLPFLAALRSLADGRRAAVVFCTSRTARHDIVQGLAAGADDYVMKPFDSDVLRSKFERLGLLREEIG